MRSGSWRVSAGVFALGVMGGFTACTPAEPEASPQVVAHVGSDTLAVEGLARLLVLGQPLPLTAATARGIAEHWVELVRVAQVGVEDLRTPRRTLDVVWPLYRAAVVDRRLSERVARASPTPGEVEAAFEGNEFRLLARVLRRLSPAAHPDERQFQLGIAQQVHRDLLNGMPWPQAVEASEDEASVARMGLLGVVTEDDLPPELRRAAFELEAGAISSVLETEEGFQILYRPPLESARGPFREGLHARLLEREREHWVDSWVAARGAEVAPEAGTVVLELLEDGAGPGAAPPRSLARWDGGSLSDTVVVRYLATLDTEARARLVAGGANAGAELIDEIVRQEVVWAELGVPLDPTAAAELPAEAREAWDQVSGEWRTQVDAYAEVVDDVDAYLQAVVARRRAPLQLPAALSGIASSEAVIDPAGVTAAVARAQSLVDAAGPSS